MWCWSGRCGGVVRCVEKWWSGEGCGGVVRGVVVSLEVWRSGECGGVVSVLKS